MAVDPRLAGALKKAFGSWPRGKFAWQHPQVRDRFDG